MQAWFLQTPKALTHSVLLGHEQGCTLTVLPSPCNEGYDSWVELPDLDVTRVASHDLAGPSTATLSASTRQLGHDPSGPDQAQQGQAEVSLDSKKTRTG